MATRTMKYITGDDATERTWVVSFNYTKPRVATYLDPAEGEEFDFLSATSGDLTLDADDWIAEHGVDLGQLEENATEAMSDEDERENGPSDEQTWAHSASCAGVAPPAWSGR